jgi:hypothetical protein
MLDVAWNTPAISRPDLKWLMPNGKPHPAPDQITRLLVKVSVLGQYTICIQSEF